MHARTFVAVAIAAVIASGPARAVPMPTDAFFFGDSLVDVGFAFANTDPPVPPTPPYYMGQFTGPDGPVWAEIVGDAVEAAGGDVRNYGVGGAEALGNGPTDLAAQAFVFGQEVAGGIVTPGAHAAAAFLIGANDIFGALGSGNSEAVAEGAADMIAGTARSLSVLGIDKALFFTLGDLSQLPLFGGDPSAGAFAQAASAAFDARIAANAGSLVGEGFDVTLVDTGALLAAVRSEPAAYGFTNVTDACVIRDGSTVLQDCTADPAVDAGRYLYFDQVHPGSRAHAIVADTVLREFAVIPLPTTLPLAAAAFAILLVMRRRRD